MTTMVCGCVGVGAGDVVGVGATVVVVGFTMTGGGRITAGVVVLGAGAAVVVGDPAGAGTAVVVVVVGIVTVLVSTAELSAALLSPKVAGVTMVTEFAMLVLAEETRLLEVKTT